MNKPTLIITTSSSIPSVYIEKSEVDPKHHLINSAITTFDTTPSVYDPCITPSIVTAANIEHKHSSVTYPLPSTLNSTDYNLNTLLDSKKSYTYPISKHTDVTWIGVQPTPYVQPDRERLNFNGNVSYLHNIASSQNTSGGYNQNISYSSYQVPTSFNPNDNVPSSPYMPSFAQMPMMSYPLRHEPKWNISFSGLSDGLDIQDFVFRFESLARRENIPMYALDSILPKLLKEKAEKLYWVFTRKFPNATYEQIKNALLQRFSSYESDRETRRVIETRKQKFREPISDFLLEIESLNGRVSNRFSEIELVEIARENMSHELQQVTLTTKMGSIEELRSICQKYERLWCRIHQHRPNFSDTMQRRSTGINEIYSPYDENHQLMNPNQYGWVKTMDNLTKETLHVDAINRKKNIATKANMWTKDPKDYIICWNCQDLGHRYQDCPLPPQGIFCYGCGKPGTIKPQCPHYHSNMQGKDLPEVKTSGLSRPVQILSRHSQVLTSPKVQTETTASNTEPPQLR